MGRQSKAKKSDNFGKGKVTPVQIAFIVDRYLSDNKFSETRSIFRNEAASLISKSPVQEAPKSLLSLGAMLDEYICLKEQKVMLDQESVRLEQEKCRVQNLLHGMQTVMNAYNASGSTPAPPIPAAATKSVVVVPQPNPTSASPSGCPVYKTPTVVPVPSNTNTRTESFSSPVTEQPTRKRSSLMVFPQAPPVAKKSRSKLTCRNLPNQDTNAGIQLDRTASIQEIAQPSSGIQSSPNNWISNGSLVQGSSVAKCLFNQPMQSPPTNSSGPKTPPQADSQNEKPISPPEISSTANFSNNTPEVTPTHCTVISSERVKVSPFKQTAYYSVERNHWISSSSPVKTNSKRVSKRDHVKGRLDFDGSDVARSSDKTIADGISTSESEKEVDIFDLDLPNLDAIGSDFSFTELLVDFDFDCEGISNSCQLTLDGPMDNVSGSPSESRGGNLEGNQILSEFSSTVTEVLSEKEMNIQGSDTLTAVKSITKCIRILSPAKSHRSFLDQENCSARS